MGNFDKKLGLARPPPPVGTKSQVCPKKLLDGSPHCNTTSSSIALLATLLRIVLHHITYIRRLHFHCITEIIRLLPASTPLLPSPSLVPTNLSASPNSLWSLSHPRFKSTLCQSVLLFFLNVPVPMFLRVGSVINIFVFEKG